MVKGLVLLVGVVGFLNLTSCKPKKVDPPAPVPVDNHIGFKLDGEQVSAKFKVLLQDEIFNGYYKTTKSISMERLVSNGNPEGLIFAFSRIDLDKVALPITVKFSSVQEEATVSLTYVSPDNMLFGTNSANPDDFSVTINSYKNKIINCTFNGTLYSGKVSRPSVVITEGDLNLELKVIE